MIDENKDVRWIQRFANFQKAFSQLTKFIDKAELSELEEQGLIKAFEYTFELAWTTLKDFLEYRGQSDIYGSRDAIRKAFQLNLIDDGENWMDMLISQIEAVILYGSRAKDNFKPGSDIDLTLIGNELNLTVLNKISLELDDLLLPYTFDLSLYHHIKQPDLIDHIQRVGKVFYSKKE
jgi:nucleotidyltransferase substrate binding protein (TIGR01987 family)